MTDESGTLSEAVTIVNELGLHARSAAKIAQIAQRATRTVWVIKDDQEADARSVIDVLTLEGHRGGQLRFRIEHPDDRPLMEALVRLVAEGFGE